MPLCVAVPPHARNYGEAHASIRARPRPAGAQPRRLGHYFFGEPGGVHVASIEIDGGPLLPRYEPGSPFADERGYVGYPNVDPTIELMNAMEAARAYEANISAIEATKSMLSAALQIIA